VLQVARNLVDASHTGKSAGGHPLASGVREALPLGIVLTAGVLLFVGHARAYGAWLIDDAGIAIAYATNLAHGFGLVAQPGAAPVEGYTDALWVFLLALCTRVGAIALPGTLKLISCAFVAATYAALLAIIRRVALHPLLVGAAVLLFCSANPSFVIWCTSGLENALYSFLIVLLALLTLRALEADPAARQPVALCGLVAALVMATRPDGALYAVLAPAILIASRRTPRHVLVPYAFAFGAPTALLLGARLVIFHHLVPNTYAAKGGVRIADVLEFAFLMPNGVHKLEGLLEGAFSGIVTNAVFFAALVAARLVAARGRFTPSLATVNAFAFVALADFMLLPADRMAENRFATPFYPLYYASVFGLLDVALDVPAVRRKGLAVCALAGSLFLACAPDFSGRALLFARAPSIGLFFVKGAFADRFDRYAQALHVSAGSVALPDVGGMLLWSHLSVIDLAGLCDARIARYLFRDPPATREYVLGEVRPTFIHVADIWAKATAFEEDPRFAIDYAPIHAYTPVEDPASDGHAAGFFVRRDAIGGEEAILEPLRRDWRSRLDFLPPPADSALLDWLDRTPLVPSEYRTRLSLILHNKSTEVPPE
jgi:hypothetical protein